MAHEPEPEVIRQQMAAQRAAIDAKIETLENRIIDTVEGARAAVEETVQNVKEGVQESVETVKESVHSSVETVKETFDLRLQVMRRPWIMVGGAIAVGFAAGCVLNRFARAQSGLETASSDRVPGASETSRMMRSEALESGTTMARPEPQKHHLSSLLAPELDKLKGLAVGTALGMVREIFCEPLPEPIKPQLNEVIDRITEKLGGERLPPQMLQRMFPHREPHHSVDMRP